MAVDIKVAPDEKLELVQTYITDTNSNSDYFNISELPDTFSGGKNAFLLAGSDKLLANTEIKIQIRDSEGKVCYIEYSNGSPEYYEGNSKVVAVYVYPNTTAFGPATITILGQLKDVPQEWNGLYSVKWTKQININPALANTTRVRFYKRPQVSITEIVEPLYTIVSGSKTPSLIQGSFASIKVNQLETFAGDVKRIKVYRTALGDISDYDLIQDILVESKNLLTTYALSGSVVGDGGVFTNDSLSKLWLTGSLYGALNSTYINDGLQLTGSGALTYSSSLNLLSSNTYELQLDSFFTGSTANKLGIYVSYPTQSILGQPYTATTPIATLNGTTPTKNFGTQTFPFNVPFDYPTASLYLSQDSGTTQWHVGNISLNVSQDTAFSPNEISFITSMPTVLTNETFNFKFEFYDVNNNYVPVAVTQSAVFVGGTNFNTLQSGSLYASSSVSASLAALSQSVSGTISLTSQSVSSSIAATSSSLSSSISKSASDTSASSANFIILVSGSLNDSIDLVSGSVVLLSSSVSTSLSTLSASLSSSVFGQASQSLYQVYSASAFLDKFIFTDETGKLNSPPTASGNGLYLGSTYLGYYSQSVWRTYMDDQGDFYLTGSNNNFLAWSGQLGTLQVQGVINIQGGNAATTSSVATAAANAVTSGSNSATAVSNSLSPNIFTNENGLINRPPAVLVGSPSGLYLSPSYMGYYTGTNWNTYMGNDGKFFLTGSASNYLKWDGTNLNIQGSINITGTGNAATQDYAGSTASGSLTTATTRLNASSSVLQSNITGVDGKVFTDSTGKLSKTPATGSQTGLFLGSTYLGYYNGTDWKTYMANNGNFYLSGAGTDSLSWVGGVLTINGAINITGGGAATAITNATNAASYALANANTSSISAAAGAASYALANANTSSISAAAGAASYALANANTSSIAAAAGAASYALANANTASIFTSAAGAINKAPSPSGAGLYLGSTHLGYYNGSAWKTYMSSSGDFSLSGAGSNGLTWNAGASTLSIDGNITARNGTFIGSITSTATISGGTISGGAITGGTISIGSGNTIFKADSNGIYLGNATFADAPFRVSPGGVLNASNATISGNITATGGSIGGWLVDADKLKSSDSVTRLDSTNTEFAVMDSDNLNYYRVRIGNVHPTKEWPSGTGFIGGTQLKTFTEIVPGGIRLTAGTSPNTGQVVYSQMDGYKNSGGIGVGFRAYNEVAGTNANSALYIAMTNSTGVTDTLASMYTNGGAWIGNTSNLNQGYALITDGPNYLNTSAVGNTIIRGTVYLQDLVVDSANTRGVRWKTNGYITTDSSSRRYKKNIESTTLEEAKRILNLRVVTYHETAQKDVDPKMTGLIAEEVDELGYKDFVSYMENGPENVNYQYVFSSMLKVIQDLNNRVETLETQLNNK